MRDSYTNRNHCPSHEMWSFLQGTQDISNRAFEWLYLQRYSELQPIISHTFIILTEVILGICWAILETDTWETLVDTEWPHRDCRVCMHGSFRWVITRDYQIIKLGEMMTTFTWTPLWVAVFAFNALMCRSVKPMSSNSHHIYRHIKLKFVST